MTNDTDAVGAAVSDEELDRLERLEKAATPAPWHAGATDQHRVFKWGYSHVLGFSPRVVFDANRHFPFRDDVRLVAAARNALPALLAEVRRLRARDAGVARLEKWRCGHKARAVRIDIDNGYGATCWDVTLWGEWGKDPVTSSEAEIMREAEDRGEDPDWPGVAAVINRAIDKAEAKEKQ